MTSTPSAADNWMEMGERRIFERPGDALRFAVCERIPTDGLIVTTKDVAAFENKSDAVRFLGAADSGQSPPHFHTAACDEGCTAHACDGLRITGKCSCPPPVQECGTCYGSGNDDCSGLVHAPCPYCRRIVSVEDAANAAKYADLSRRHQELVAAARKVSGCMRVVEKYEEEALAVLRYALSAESDSRRPSANPKGETE